MNILYLIFRPSSSRLSLIGWVLVLVGLGLSVFVIGLPILVIGWLILVFDLFRSFYFTLVPPSQREKLAKYLAKEYQPYQPASQSLKTIIWEMLRTAGFILITSLLIIILGYKLHWW